MQNSKITMKELLYKMACYQELYPNVHLFEKTDLNQMNSNCLSSTIEAFRLKKDCTKLEYCKDKLYHVISKYYVVDQKEYVMEIICCLDEQLELSRQENSNLILKYLGKHDDFYLDVLTGAYNRRFYEEKIKHQTTPAGIVMLDVDDFKIYNDTFGHDFGDRVLKMIVEHIKNSLRNQDKLIRYGGDEFIIYLPNIEIEDFYLIMQNILENIHHATIRRYESVQFSLSAGITMYQTGTIEEAVSLADHLLYHAKRKKNCIFTELDHQYYSDRNDTKQTILIVDDSELNRAILYEILKDDFYLLEATNGQECIDYIKQYGSGISLILLDIIMPEIDGFDVLQWMEQEKWLDDIPVILISSEDSANIINKGFAMGASDYIKRPFDYRIVYRRVYNIIKLYAKQKRLMDLLKKQVEKNSALSLALGLSRMIQEYAGGIELNTLFIDEGFGSLDSQSLDQAMNCLMELHQDNKLIGIISHVSELKDRIDRQIIVDRKQKQSVIHVR